jgi:small-conductance mechanosensitive channel
MGAWLDKLWNKIADDYIKQFSIEELSIIVQHVIKSLLILLFSMVLLFLARRSLLKIERRVDRIRGAAYRRRIETITSLVFSSIKYTVYISCVIWILAEWGFNTQTLIVGSAVLGAALGFGSQGLVQDIITGLSILAEEQLALGDFVEIAGKTGAVEEVGLRVIKIRDPHGAQHVIFNRTIGMVSNFTAGGVQAWVDVSIDNADAGPKALAVAESVCKDMAAELPVFPTAPRVEGLHSSATKDVFVRIKVAFLPAQEEVVRTIFTDRIKSAFAANEIHIPNDRIRIVILSELFKSAVQKGERFRSEQKA